MPREPRKPKNIQPVEDDPTYGLGGDWRAIDAPVINPNAPPIPYNSRSNYFSGSIPSSLQHDSNFVDVLRGPNHIPTLPLTPIGPSGKPTTNTGVQSTATPIVQTVSVQVTGSAINQVLPGTVQGSGAGTTFSVATLNNINDGSSRFAQTASGTSFRPLSNPLTSTDAGASATINIAGFTMRISNKPDVAVSSGSILLLSYSTLYYIYYDDASLAGGAVTFNATTTKETAINGSGRFFIGSIRTPVATAPATAGNGDGGSGAQNGQTYLFLYGSAVASALVNTTANNISNSIDGDLTTFGSLITVAGGNASGQILLSAASPTSATWTSLTLNILSAVPQNVAAPPASVKIEYSLDGGANFINLYTAFGTTRAKTTDSISLPVTQNLALVLVKGSILTGGVSLTAELDIYEAWAVGVI